MSNLQTKVYSKYWSNPVLYKVFRILSGKIIFLNIDNEDVFEIIDDYLKLNVPQMLNEYELKKKTNLKLAERWLEPNTGFYQYIVNTYLGSKATYNPKLYQIFSRIVKDGEMATTTNAMDESILISKKWLVKDTFLKKKHS